MILPKGGSREDLIVTEKLYEYIGRQALEWFQFADGYKKDGQFVTIPNGNLTLVTGVDKAPEWSVFSFWRQKLEDTKESDPLSVEYSYGVPDPWTAPESDAFSLWNNHCPEYEGSVLACAFVRGLRIAISPTAWQEVLPTDIPDSLYNVPAGNLVTSTTQAAPMTRSLRKIQPNDVQEVSLFPISFLLGSSDQLAGNISPIVHHHSNDVIQGAHSLALRPTTHFGQISKSRWPRLIVVDDALWCPFVKGVGP